MPELDGITATASCSPPARTSAWSILTTFEQDDYIFGALRAGASGFLLKRSTPEELIAAIHTVAAGDALLSPSVTRRVIERMAQQPTPDLGARRPARRPHRARARGAPADRPRTLERARSPTRWSIEESTVKTHVKRILTKLDAPRPHPGRDLRLRERGDPTAIGSAGGGQRSRCTRDHLQSPVDLAARGGRSDLDRRRRHHGHHGGHDPAAKRRAAGELPRPDHDGRVRAVAPARQPPHDRGRPGRLPRRRDARPLLRGADRGLHPADRPRHLLRRRTDRGGRQGDRARWRRPAACRRASRARA